MRFVVVVVVVVVGCHALGAQQGGHRGATPKIDQEYNAPFFSLNGQEIALLGMSGSAIDRIGNLTAHPDLVAIGLFFPPTAAPQQPWALPQQIGVATKLAVLFVQGAVQGSIPTQVGLLHELQVLIALDNDGLEGELPTHIGHLTNLAHLEIIANRIRGPLPTQLGLLTQLTILGLGNNGLSGTIPSQLGGLSRLTRLVLRSNGLSGPLPSELGLMRVRHVTMKRNQLSGSIPSQLAALATVVEVNGPHNGFTGALPTQFGLASNLEFVDLTNNQLSGSLPSQLALAQRLGVLLLDNNHLQGTLATELCSSGIAQLSLSHNELGGELPSQLALLSASLDRFEAEHNGFTGLPSQLGRVSLLTTLRLSGNLLGVRLPTELGNLEVLHTLEAARCELHGTVPSQLGRLTLLRSLALNDNSLGGTLPSQFARMTALTSLLLHANHFRGTLAPEFASLVALETVWVANNELGGSAPAPVWEEHCDDSGLDTRRCKYTCGDCGGAWVQLRRCDWKGRGKWCVPWAVVGCFWAACIAMIAGVYRGILRQGNGRTLYCTTRTCFGLLDITTDFLFAVNHSGWVGNIALSSWVVVWAVKVAHAANTMRRQGCVASVRGKGRWGVVCAVSSVDAAALHEAVVMDDQSIGMSISIALLGLVESVLAGSLQLSVVLRGDRDTITWVAFVISACNVVALGTVATIMTLSWYHTDREKRKRRDREQSAELRPGLLASTRTRRRLAAVLLCCTIAGAAMSSPATTGTAAPASATVERAPMPLATPSQQHHALSQARSVVPVPTHKSTQCPSTAPLSVDLPFVCAFGQLLVVAAIGGVEIDFGAVIRDNPSLSMLIVEYYYTTIPPEVGQLSDLVSLSIARATGPMVSEIGLLPKLQLLDFAHTRHLPLVSEVGLLASLGILRIRECDYTDTVLPTQLGQLSAVSVLEFSSGFLQADGLLSWIGKLTGLENLWLASIGLEGAVPSQFGALTRLTSLGLGGNRLSGTLPSQLVLLTELTLFSIHGSSVEGTIPPALLGAQVEHFDARDNRLTGRLPALALWSQAVFVDVGGNLLSGPIPSQLGRGSRLQALLLDNNNFSGTLATQLGLLTQLTALLLNDNGVQGKVAKQLAAMTALRVVDVASNELSGMLPAAFSNASQQSVWLQSCDWSGLDEAACKRECPACALGTVELKGCDASGHNQLCAPLFLVMVVIGLVAFAMRLLLRALSRRKASHKSLAWASVMSTLAAVHLLLDVLFARTSRRALSIPAGVAIAVAVGFRLVLVANEFVRLDKQGKLEKMQEQYKRFAIAVVLCVVDPPTLLWIAHTGSRRRLLLVRGRVFASMFVPDLVLMAVQATAVSQSGSAIALQALFASGLSVGVALCLWCPAELRSLRRVSSLTIPQPSSKVRPAAV